jgi:DNA-binding transcriptional ArsR family regulator
VSKEEIPWDKVAKELVKTLGTETARGLLYAFTIQSMYPTIVEAIRSLVSKPRASDEEIKEIARKIQEAMGSQPQLQPQPQLTREDIEKRIAQILMQTAGTGGYTTTTSAPPSYPPQAPPDVKFEVESIENKIRALEEARNQLLSKRYTTLNDEEKMKIEQRLREVEMEINSEKQRLMIIRQRWMI